MSICNDTGEGLHWQSGNSESSLNDGVNTERRFKPTGDYGIKCDFINNDSKICRIVCFDGEREEILLVFTCEGKEKPVRLSEKAEGVLLQILLKRRKVC